jgi:hypothetical protein
MAPVDFVATILQHVTHSSYGMLRFEVHDKGDIYHTETQITLKQEAKETIPDFVARIRGLLQPGDKVEITIKNREVQVVRIDRPKTE